MASRSPYPFMRRKQMRSLGWPGSEFSPGALLVNQYPAPAGKSLSSLILGEGAPPADRVVLPDWNPPSSSTES